MNFDFSFFAPSRVLALESSPLMGPLSGNENFSLQAKHP